MTSSFFSISSSSSSLTSFSNHFNRVKNSSTLQIKKRKRFNIIITFKLKLKKVRLISVILIKVLTLKYWSYTTQQIQSYVNHANRKNLRDVKMMWLILNSLNLNLAEYLNLLDIATLRNLFTNDDDLLKIVNRWVQRWKINFSVHQITADKIVTQTQLWSFVIIRNSVTSTKLQQRLSLSASWYVKKDKRILIFWLAIMY